MENKKEIGEKGKEGSEGKRAMKREQGRTLEKGEGGRQGWKD